MLSEIRFDSRCAKHKNFILEQTENGDKAYSQTGGVCISFGWNSMGIGKKNGFEIIEILLVAHGGMHNDTIVTVETKL